MSWYWIVHDASGGDLRVTEELGTRDQAEAWMGDAWEGLRAAGGASVTLVGDDRSYYTMGLGEQ